MRSHGSRAEYVEPEPGEIRGSGFAFHRLLNGTVTEVESCQTCARAACVTWRPGFFEGECQGCGCRLEPQ